MMTSAPTDNTAWLLPFAPAQWEQTPGEVQAYLVALQTQLHELQAQQQCLPSQVEQLQARLATPSKTSNKPPSSDSPFTQPARRSSSGKRGARPGHPGAGITLLAPTEVHHVYPAPSACGAGELGRLTASHAHQSIELPPITLEVRHFRLYQASCVGCGALLKADIPASPSTGYGPRLTALISELGGMPRASRRLVQDFCQSVLGLPISLGAMQKGIDRTAAALVPS